MKKSNMFLAVALALAFVSGCHRDGGKESADAVPYSELTWTGGDFDGSGAVLTEPRISNLVVAPPASLTFHWDVDLASWGYSPTKADAIAALFVKLDGRWVGGKFEWISSSRNFRDLKNARTGYNGLNTGILTQAREFAFVVVSKDGLKRSNVVLWKR